MNKLSNKADGTATTKHPPSIGYAKLTKEQVDHIRKTYATDTTIMQKDLAAKYSVTPANISRIIMNTSWHDENYMPPTSNRTKQFSAPRKSAPEYQYHCNTCGMGCDSQAEAEDCCKQRRETDTRYSQQYKAKYGSHADPRGQEWKYTKARRLHGGLQGLGENHGKLP